jgi:hypothetical protein
MIRNGNAYSGLIMLATTALILIGYFIILPVFGQLFNMFYDDTTFSAQYPTELSCRNHGYWYSGSCHQLPVAGKQLFLDIRSRWLLAPVIFIISLIVWFFTTVTRRDPQHYMR